MKKIKKRKGFTLIEMVITITIIVILSAISVPLFKDYIGQSKLSEGYALLGRIKSAQENYYNEYGRFLCGRHSSSAIGNSAWISSTCNETVLGIDARSNKYYTKFCVGNMDDGSIPYAFEAYVYGVNANCKNLTLTFNITAGVTVK